MSCPRLFGFAHFNIYRIILVGHAEIHKNNSVPKAFTVKKAKRNAGPKHEGDGKFRRPRRMIGKFRHQHKSGSSIYVDDRIFRDLMFF
jgi:hypothetical protein